jgi:hypothetical protein
MSWLPRQKNDSKTQKQELMEYMIYIFIFLILLIISVYVFKRKKRNNAIRKRIKNKVQILDIRISHFEKFPLSGNYPPWALNEHRNLVAEFNSRLKDYNDLKYSALHLPSRKLHTYSEKLEELNALVLEMRQLHPKPFKLNKEVVDNKVYALSALNDCLKIIPYLSRKLDIFNENNWGILDFSRRKAFFVRSTVEWRDKFSKKGFNDYRSSIDSIQKIRTGLKVLHADVDSFVAKAKKLRELDTELDLAQKLKPRLKATKEIVESHKDIFSEENTFEEIDLNLLWGNWASAVSSLKSAKENLNLREGTIDEAYDLYSGAMQKLKSITSELDTIDEIYFFQIECQKGA